MVWVHRSLLAVVAHLCPSAEAIGCRRCTSHSPSSVQLRPGEADVERDEVTHSIRLYVALYVLNHYMYTCMYVDMWADVCTMFLN